MSAWKSPPRLSHLFSPQDFLSPLPASFSPLSLIYPLCVRLSLVRRRFGYLRKLCLQPLSPLSPPPCAPGSELFPLVDSPSIIDFHSFSPFLCSAVPSPDGFSREHYWNSPSPPFFRGFLVSPPSPAFPRPISLCRVGFSSTSNFSLATCHAGERLAPLLSSSRPIPPSFTKLGIWSSEVRGRASPSRCRRTRQALLLVLPQLSLAAQNPAIFQPRFTPSAPLPSRIAGFVFSVVTALLLPRVPSLPFVTGTPPCLTPPRPPSSLSWTVSLRPRARAFRGPFLPLLDSPVALSLTKRNAAMAIPVFPRRARASTRGSTSSAFFGFNAPFTSRQDFPERRFPFDFLFKKCSRLFGSRPPSLFPWCLSPWLRRLRPLQGGVSPSSRRAAWHENPSRICGAFLAPVSRVSRLSPPSPSLRVWPYFFPPPPPSSHAVDSLIQHLLASLSLSPLFGAWRHRHFST